MLDPRDQAHRATQLAHLGIISMGASGATGVYVGLSTASLSILGFGIDAVIGAMTSIVLVGRIRADLETPRRHDRMEALAGTAVGLAQLLLATYLGIKGLFALADGTHPEPSLVGAVLLLVSILVLFPLGMAKRRTAAVLSSGAMRADAMLTLFAAILAMVSLAAIALDAILGLVWADALAAVVIAVLVAREGWTTADAAISDRWR